MKFLGVLGFEQFEYVLEWGSGIRDIVLDSMFRHLHEFPLRVVVFAYHSEKPRLYYGSAEEYTFKTITFHRLSER